MFLEEELLNTWMLMLISFICNLYILEICRLRSLLFGTRTMNGELLVSLEDI